MIDTIVSTLNGVATAIGYVFLFSIGLLVALKVYSARAFLNASDDAKEVGAMMKKEHGYDSGLSALLAEGMFEALDELPDSHLSYSPQPLCQVDFSLDDADSTDRNVIESALEEAGYVTHPFPREREGEWSTTNFGVWKTKPRFYIEQEHGEKVNVTPEVRADVE